MHGYQHKQMGIAAGIGVVAYTILAKAPVELTLCMITTPVGAMLPDIDHDKSKLGATRKKATGLIKFGITLGIIGVIVLSYISGGLRNAILNTLILGVAGIIIHIIEGNKFVKAQLGFVLKHRGIMHTCIVPILFMATTLWMETSIYNYAMYGLSLGYMVHLLGDMSTLGGAPIFWPIMKRNIRYFKFHTTKNSGAISFVCWMWCIIFIGLGIYLGLKGGK